MLAGRGARDHEPQRRVLIRDPGHLVVHEAGGAPGFDDVGVLQVGAPLRMDDPDGALRPDRRAQASERMEVGRYLDLEEDEVQVRADPP
jgi:hypothetical protein